MGSYISDVTGLCGTLKNITRNVFVTLTMSLILCLQTLLILPCCDRADWINWCMSASPRPETELLFSPPSPR